MRIAAIDVGTNTVRVLVADRNGALRIVARGGCVTALGEGLSASGRLDDAACQRTLATIADYAALARKHNAERVVAVATSAVRDARNGAEFTQRVERLASVSLKTVSGDEEARLTFAGAAHGCALGQASAVVFDLGGGSTEFILGRGHHVQKAVSVNLGSRRQTTRAGLTQPATAQAMSAVMAEARATIPNWLGELPAETSIIGVGGTVTTVAALALGMKQYDPEQAQGFRLKQSAITALIDQLAMQTVEEIAAQPGLEPGRAEVLLAGLLIVGEILGASRRDELTVSTHGILMGLALSA